MLKKIFSKLLRSLVVIISVITLTFFMIHALPNNFIDEELDESVKEQIIKTYNLDKPITEQYVKYIKNVVKGDFGKSIKYENIKVVDVIKKNFPTSLDLGLRVILISSVIALLLAMLSINFEKIDRLFLLFSSILVAIPSFVVVGLLQFYAVYIHKELLGFSKISIIGYYGKGEKILPVLTLVLYYLPIIFKLLRKKIKEEFKNEYVEFAMSKGFSINYVIRKHILKNIFPSLITSLMPYFVSLITGSFIVETLFGIPGLGRYFTTSIIERDYPMIMGLTIFYTIILVIIFSIMDILVLLLDKRLKVIEDEE
ncbi:ABC transporter permease [Streptobacillus felis]|uniref:ABC transporter permease n=1 Tax=Streptobacillus felis TaxID=1384509 RepID=UPI0008298D82|nr:ABC transporter permease [Streptobacillus felis]